MIDPSLPLQAAIVAALKADAALKVLIDGRVFDDVPAGVTFPYISLGPDDPLDDPDTCVGGARTDCQINIWSRAVGRVEAKRILQAAIVVLDTALDVEGHAVTIHQVVRSTVLRDPDDKTKHGVLTMRYATTPTP